MEAGKLNVEFRSNKGKTEARRLRSAGKIPAVCYGGEGEPIMISVDPKALQKSLDPDKRTNTVITMTVAGAPKGQETLTVMVRDYQRDSIRGDLTHADFIRIDLAKPVRAVVPLVLTGKAEGVKLGGILHANMRSLAISCPPDKIPTKIEIDITTLGMGDVFHVSDVKLPEGARSLVAPTETICSVTAPKAEKVAEAAPEAAAAAVGADGKPVAAAAAGAKDAKAAPAAAAEKKGK